MLASLIRLMRPGDWTKNVFVLAAPIFWLGQVFIDPAPTDPDPDVWAWALHTAMAFAAFCALASGFYAINDALDYEKDRMHPVKCQRPVASGAVPRQTAVIFGLVLGAVGLGLGFSVNRGLGFILITYAILQAAYNLVLKRVLLVDVVTLALGFALRAAAGALAIRVQVSIWLMLCVFFLCLYLAFIKRLCDISSAEAAGDSEWKSPAGYDSRQELDWLLGITAVLAIMTYLMYSLSDHAAQIFGARALGFAIMTPLVLISVYRFYRRARLGISDSPLKALRDDPTTILSVACFGLGTVLTLFVPQVERFIRALFDTSSMGLPA